MSYNWDLIQRLLHEVQTSGNDSFKPRRYAEEHAAQMESDGQPMPNLDSLRAEAADYESLLFEGGFIVARPEEQGGNGENFVLTERGTRLLAILDNQQDVGQRQRLADKGEAALVPEVFDEMAAGRA
ncbi:transcriptional regulator [Pseudomonas stutzeri]|uniref:Transcriptional regulator n=1 Tax=Stutzerimonas stutzeri TaxID=316 RepID=A0A2N8S6Y7_STUST|nr:transcriptional regulator [Stutzerimonas stutzeri]MCQ4294694.1 transcriptional regulator [Stutzerimonas stutzeri]PNF82387.1 transcriptional regulator [Stutzerimonas stutzeri]